MLQTSITCQCPPDRTLDEFVESCADALVSAIALDLTDQGALNLDCDQTRCEQATAFFRSRNVDITVAALTSSLYQFYNFACHDAQSRDLARKMTEALLQRAAWLGAPLIYVPQGSHGVDAGGSGSYSYEEAMRHTHDGLAACIEHAERLGVRVAIVVPAPRFLLSPLEVRDLIDRLNSPVIGAALHLDALAQIGYAEDWLRILAYRARCLLLTDVQGLPVALEAADQLDDSLLQALQETGFDGPLICEAKGSPQLRRQ